MGHEIPETPPLPPVKNSSAFPLKSRITFPVLTSKMFSTTLYIKIIKILEVTDKTKKEKKKKSKIAYVGITGIAGFMATICYQVLLPRREINQFYLFTRRF